MAVIKSAFRKYNRHSGNPNWHDAANVSVKALTTAALLMPGLLQSPAQAAEDDSVDFQYSHYQEGRRDGINKLIANNLTGVMSKYAVPNKRNPIEVDSLHGSGRFTLTDRVKFAFNYSEDTWSGATPFGSAPEQSGANSTLAIFKEDGTPLISGASSFASAEDTLLDSRGNPYYSVIDPITSETTYEKDRTVHVLSYASPETRQQGDFKLGYEWDEAALDVGGGISIERDYESRFVNLGGRMDFNQKQTTVNVGLSYTNSAIDSVLNPSANAGPDIPYFDWSDQHKKLISYDSRSGLTSLRANRQDWATQLGLSQVINKDASLELGMGYSRSTGYLENPYKTSWIFGANPGPATSALPDGTGLYVARGNQFIEQRPDVRNQWNWSARWIQYVAPMDAALHLEYQFAVDDWGINAHTFTADWVQPLGAGWTITPRVRYYSQEAADFYQPYFVVNRSRNGQNTHLGNPNGYSLPDNFSSDQRLSGYGTLSGGVTVSKQFAKGIGVEAGFEYYSHQGDLKLGGGGEQAFADFDYWVANAALKVNLSALGQDAASGDVQLNHHDHATLPAGILFGHTLANSGDMMVGYRYQHSQQGSGFLQGNNSVSELQVTNNGCPGLPRKDSNRNSIATDGNCPLLPSEMIMNMHMLELMVAPTDWLTLMVMPQFMNMDMPLYMPLVDADTFSHVHSHPGHIHETGGIGDTGLYGLLKLFDNTNHHLHLSVGVSAPTGDVDIKLKDGQRSLDEGFIHYGMQLGSGTWDFKPSLTYTGKVNDWSWGAQVSGTKRLQDRNKSGYALGDLFESSLWGGYDLTHWLSATVRAAYTWQGSIEGRYVRRETSFEEPTCNQADFIYSDTDSNEDPVGPPYLHETLYNACLNAKEIHIAEDEARDRHAPMDYPANYGGHYVDIGLGLSATVPSGSLAGNSLSLEWLQPVYTDVNGYQLDRDGALSFTWSYGF